MMKDILKDRTGSVGVGTIIIFTGILIFIVLPLTSFVFDQLKIQVVAGEVRQAINTAVEESYHSLQVPFLSKDEFRADNGLFQYYVEERLEKSLKLNSDKTPKAGSMLDGPFDIDSLLFIDSSMLPYTDSDTGKVYNRAFVEVEFTIRVKPLLYQQIVLEALGQPYKELSSKKKVTLPINN
ncbi:MAG: hypothetical protein JEZ08_16575 [Clostridiales bacterium]|nr:hypothetical protein [Clostridiales bacterium]